MVCSILVHMCKGERELKNGEYINHHWASSHLFEDRLKLV